MIKKLEKKRELKNTKKYLKNKKSKIKKIKSNILFSAKTTQSGAL